MTRKYEVHCEIDKSNQDDNVWCIKMAGLWNVREYKGRYASETPVYEVADAMNAAHEALCINQSCMHHRRAA